MPYKVRKRKCKNASGKKGKYVITKSNDNKKISCHTSKSKANAAVRAKYANEEIEEIMEEVFLRLLEESKYAGSHPEESYQYGWPEFDEKEFDKDGITTWYEDREWTKQYYKSMGMIK